MNTIFISIDSKYFDLSIEFLKNIKANYPTHPIIHICYLNLSSTQMEKMRNINTNIRFIENNLDENIVGPIMSHLNHTEFNPRVFYARFLIWGDYFKEYNKILHLDVDMFILKPLENLFDMEDFFIVKDVYDWHDFKDLNNTALQIEFGNDKINQIPIWSNAGVFLVTKKYLNKWVLDSFIDIKNRYSDYIKFADQSIISIWMKKNHIIPTDNYSYNYQFRLFFLDPLNINSAESSFIIHLNWLSWPKKLFLLKIFNLWLLKVFIYTNAITWGLFSKLIF